MMALSKFTHNNKSFTSAILLLTAFLFTGYCFGYQPSQSKGDSSVIKDVDSLYNLTYDVVLSGGDLDSAKLIINEGIELAKEHSDSVSLALIFKAESFWYYFKQDHEQGEKVAKVALKIAQAKNIYGLGKYYHGVASHLELQSKWDEALKFYMDGLEACQKQQDSVSLVPIYQGILINYRTKNDFDKAISFGKKGVAIAKRIKSDRIVNLYNDLIYCFVQQNELDSALVYAIQTEKYLDPDKNAFVFCSLKTQMGRIYSGLELTKEAINQYEQAIEIALKAGWTNRAAYAMAGKAEVLMQTNKFSEAVTIIEKALSMQIDYSLKRDLALLASESYEQLGEPQKALNYFRDYKQKNDSLNNQMYNHDVSELEVKFETAEKENLIKEQENEILILERNKAKAKAQLILIISLGSILLVIGLAITWIIISKKEQKSRELQAIGQFKESVTNMIAHDLKNPLSVILGAESEKPSVKQMAKQMLQLVNNMLDVQKFENAEMQLNTTNFSINKSIDFAIEQVRPLLSQKNICIKFDTDVNIDMVIKGDQDLIFRVIVNLLTNAIKFSPQNDTIEIILKTEADKVHFSVVDHGSGIPEDQIDSIFLAYKQVDARKSGGVASTGLGLAFCKLALKAHASDITVESIPEKFTSFTFILPLENEMADSSTISTATTEQQLVFTTKEKETLAAIIPKLKTIKLYQAIEINQLLEDIEDTNNMKAWKEAVLQAAYTNNEEYFKQLLIVAS